MGQVYKARDTRLRRLVALKVLSPDRPVTEDRRRRFLREARAASALNHPGIVTVHDIARADEVDFIVMEYVDGYSLAEKISQGSMAWRDAASIALEIGEAMVVAHDAGLVHRDLKPLNVMINSDDRVKVLDFGIAKLDPTVAADITETLTRPETEVGGSPGTLAYMSPEQFLGETLDARSDIFSFGVVLFEMLTGQRPFDAQPRAGEDGQHTFLYRLLYGEAPRIRDTLPGVPELLARLVARCLERQRIDRPQTMSEVVQDLREVLGTDPGRVLPPPIPIVGPDIATVSGEGSGETLPELPPPLPTEPERGRRRNFLRRAARLTARLIFALAFSAAVIWGLKTWQRRAQLDRIVEGEPAVALQALDEQAAHPEADPDDLLALLRQRATPTDVLKHTPAGLSGEDAVRWWLRFSELVLPWIEETPDDAVLVASLMHRLDFLDARDPRLLAQAYDLRDRVIEILRRQRPPPAIGGPEWMEVPAGDLEQLWVAAFRLLRRPVTAGEYRRLRPGSHPEIAEHRPMSAVDWYQAYAYAAWLGGRLPTEDELRHAAGICSPYGSCQSDGWQSSWSLDDMLGNTVEWVAGGAGPGPAVISAAHGSGRIEEPAIGEQPAGMSAPPTAGFRVVFPQPSLPPAITLTAPEPGATLPSGANVRISADAFDLDGRIEKVSFYVYNRGSLQPIGDDTIEPYETFWKNVADGYYVVHAEAIDDDGRKANDKAQVRIGIPRLPYHQESVTIPGKIEAEDFDLGANGAAYFDNSPGNTGRQYRTDTDVDIQVTEDVGGGFNVGWSGAGEWLEYTVEVTVSGDYDLHARVACNETGGAFHVEFDGIEKTGLMIVPETGGWQRWETVSTTIQLDAGVQVMRWRNAPTSVEFNLNYFMIVAAGSSVCGDGVCQPGEDCSSCPVDCPSVTEGWPVSRHCCGNGVTEPPEEDGSLCGGNN